MPAQQYTYDKPTKRWIHRYKTAIVVDDGGSPPAGQVAGALPIGEASYVVPPGAIFVSPAGNNTRRHGKVLLHNGRHPASNAGELWLNMPWSRQGA